MTFKVHMLAFMDRGTVKNVEVPEKEMIRATNDDLLLELIFKYGQNDFSIDYQHLPSVSVWDVVEFDNGSYHIVRPMGFLSISKEVFESLPNQISSLGCWDIEDVLKKIT